MLLAVSETSGSQRSIVALDDNARLRADVSVATLCASFEVRYAGSPVWEEGTVAMARLAGPTEGAESGSPPLFDTPDRADTTLR
jgi:hypothetical protein